MVVNTLEILMTNSQLQHVCYRFATTTVWDGQPSLSETTEILEQTWNVGHRSQRFSQRWGFQDLQKTHCLGALFLNLLDTVPAFQAPQEPKSRLEIIYLWASLSLILSAQLSWFGFFFLLLIFPSKHDMCPLTRIRVFIYLDFWGFAQTAILTTSEWILSALRRKCYYPLHFTDEETNHGN